MCRRDYVAYVRQYSAVVHMPYGREILIARWNKSDPLFDAMEAEYIDAMELTSLARQKECHFIILNEGRAVVGGTIPQYNYELIGNINGYNIYKDALVDLSI